MVAVDFSLPSLGGVTAGTWCAFPGIGVCASLVAPAFADQVLSSSLLPLAPEFVPSCSWSDDAVPSIGAQLDFMLMSLCSQLPVYTLSGGAGQSSAKVDQEGNNVEVSLPSCGAVPAVQLQLVELKEENLGLKKQLAVLQCGLEKLQSEVATLTAKFDEKCKVLYQEVSSQVVSAVLGQLQQATTTNINKTTNATSRCCKTTQGAA